MKSMTGYGRGEAAQDGHKVTVELSSVNRKQGEVTVYLPRELECLESRARDLVHRRIARGRLNVKVCLHLGESGQASGVKLNVPLARAYVRELHKLAKELNLSGNISLDLLLKAPGVLQTEEDAASAEEYWPSVEKALNAALAACVQMREREGAHIARDLQGRVETLRKAAAQIRKRIPAMTKEFRQGLAERVKAAGADPELDQDRFMKEVVYYADRSDVSEELTRLESHFQQFEDCLKSKEPVGRPLDFLAQEMNREINTIASKALDSKVSRQVVLLKSELEKFREQVQNVE